MTKINEAIHRLQEASKQDAKLESVFQVLAHRVRNRHNLTTKGLYYKMRKEGFDYSEKEYIPLFKLMAEVGLCQLQKNNKDRVIACREFKLPLKSLGEAVSGLKTFQAPKTVTEAVEVLVETKKHQVSLKAGIMLTLYLHDKLVKVEVPENITKEELIGILYKFQELNHSP